MRLDFFHAAGSFERLREFHGLLKRSETVPEEIFVVRHSYKPVIIQLSAVIRKTAADPDAERAANNVFARFLNELITAFELVYAAFFNYESAVIERFFHAAAQKSAVFDRYGTVIIVI